MILKEETVRHYQVEKNKEFTNISYEILLFLFFI